MTGSVTGSAVLLTVAARVRAVDGDTSTRLVLDELATPIYASAAALGLAELFLYR